MGRNGVAESFLVVGVLTALKVLLFPTYYSTDFEVHRNWMAITHNLPFSRWYLEATSEWTLDYPPLFAWFERSLSAAAALVDRNMLQISADGYSSTATVIFQRSSVVVTDATLVLAALWHGRRARGLRWHDVWLVLGNAGLLIVDHVHFQYNGFLLGVLAASLVALQRGRGLLAGALFAALLNLKHLFLVLAPLYFVLILRGWCVGPARGTRFLGMAAVVCAVFGASLGPVAATEQLRPLLSRLFPFGRGLLHAYWAANAWAIYAAADKALSFALRSLGRSVADGTASFTGGLVQVSSFAVLPQDWTGICRVDAILPRLLQTMDALMKPDRGGVGWANIFVHTHDSRSGWTPQATHEVSRAQVTPGIAMLCVIAAMLPCLVAAWRFPDCANAPRHAAYAALCAFMFGYHVHEKAALTFVVPLAMGATASLRASREYLRLSTVANFAMHPLLHQSQEYPIKILLLLGGTTMTCAALQSYWDSATAIAESDEAGQHGSRKDSVASSDADGSQGTPIGAPKTAEAPMCVVDRALAYHFMGLAALECVCGFILPPLLGERLPFLPLMLTSVYCGVSIACTWWTMCLEYVGLAFTRAAKRE